MFSKAQMIVVALAVLSLSAVGQQAELIDFTYSHVLPNVEGSDHRQGKFDIEPAFKSVKQLEFPAICQLRDLLD